MAELNKVISQPVLAISLLLKLEIAYPVLFASEYFQLQLFILIIVNVIINQFTEKSYINAATLKSAIKKLSKWSIVSIFCYISVFIASFPKFAYLEEGGTKIDSSKLSALAVIVCFLFLMITGGRIVSALIDYYILQKGKTN